MENLKPYPGNKGASFYLPKIVNLIPYHSLYSEPFAGSGSVANYLYSGPKTLSFNRSSVDVIKILGDLSSKVFPYLSTIDPEKYFFNHGDYRQTVKIVQFVSDLLVLDHVDVFVFFDPPYLISSRQSGRVYYDNEFYEEDHVVFLDYVTRLPFNVMISHYPCDLYDSFLKDWKKHYLKVSTRTGVVDDTLYMNYDISRLDLQCFDYIGSSRTDRQRINRKAERILSRINSLQDTERQKIIDLLLKK